MFLPQDQLATKKVYQLVPIFVAQQGLSKPSNSKPSKLFKPFQSLVYQNSIYQNPGYGPTFGGDHDVYVKDNAIILCIAYVIT